MNHAGKSVAILGGARIPFVRSFTRYLQHSNQEMLTFCLNKLAERYDLEEKPLGEVALGALLKRAGDFNLARESVLGSLLDPTTPAYDVQRACGTSLETANHIALKIAAGQIDIGIAGGSDTNSDLPVGFPRAFGRKLVQFRDAKALPDKLKALTSLRPTDLAPHFPTVAEPRTGLSMGEHCEKMVKEWRITRLAQDHLALESHQKAVAAYSAGFYDDLVYEFSGVTRDGFLRADTSIEKLAKLKPSFDFTGSGTLTAGNSTPLTDGAAAVLLASDDYARRHGYPVLAHFIDAQSAAVDFVGGEGLLMAPTVAVSELLQRNQLTLQDFDFYEIHEAFAGQVLCTLKAWESADYCKKRLGREQPLGSIDRAKMNVKGGSVALGHPFAATGARIVATLAKTLNERGAGRGLISICTAGGMGVAGILEKK